MHRFIIIVLSVLLIAGYTFVSYVAPPGLLSIPGWAPYIAA